MFDLASPKAQSRVSTNIVGGTGSTVRKWKMCDLEVVANSIANWKIEIICSRIGYVLVLQIQIGTKLLS